MRSRPTGADTTTVPRVRTREQERAGTSCEKTQPSRTLRDRVIGSDLVADGVERVCAETIDAAELDYKSPTELYAAMSVR